MLCSVARGIRRAAKRPASQIALVAKRRLGLHMLKGFFALNPGYRTLGTEAELLGLVKHGDGARDVLYQPDVFAPKRPENRLRGKTFTNVSFSKTELRGLVLTRCRFVDCLFIGTLFRACEFHDCTFEGCNPYKAQFEETYIDPRVFAKLLNPSEHSNIGVALFQGLLRNSHGCQQSEFARYAQYFFEKWKRYQLGYEYSQGKVSRWEYLREWVPSLLYDHLGGYGIFVLPFARLTLGLLSVCALWNHLAWSSYGMHNSSNVMVDHSVTLSFYFTVITMTTLGYGDFTPTTTTGMLSASAQSLLGVVWLSLLASMIIKRVSR
jgi:hypothetical protein